MKYTPPAVTASPSKDPKRPNFESTNAEMTPPPMTPTA